MPAIAQKKVNFDQSFQQKNNGKSRVEIAPVKELLHIMLAITKTGLDNDDMVNQKGTYYQDVLKHFKPFDNEPIIKTFDSLLNVSLYHYIFITGNAMTHDFAGTKLKANPNYLFPAQAVAKLTVTTNPVATYKDQIAAFARKSNFQKFYKQHQAYYKQLITEYHAGANLDRQWKWLEQNFKTRINNYLILCSPLINGLNYTTKFEDQDFTQILMVLPPLDNDPARTARQNELFNTRVMFTEIDHNYVGGPSQTYKKDIDSAFKDRLVWVNDKTDGTYAYPNPLKVFDEYMTYGVFVLYCKDQYDAASYQEARKDVITLMADRGFPNMERFVTALENVRAAAPDQKIDDLYPRLLELLKQ